MTLAIGMACTGGFVLAADTRVVYSDHSTSDMEKIISFPSTHGVFGIAHSSDDANAGASLAREVEAHILSSDPNEFHALEHAIKQALQEWYLPVHDERPRISLLIIACLGRGLNQRALYFCEPPNTVIQADNYKAIGVGWTVSDPIYQHWLTQGIPYSIHGALCRVSYMMHKAKQLRSADIGGETDAVLITESSMFPYHISRISMAEAEKVHGVGFDRKIAAFASLAMSGDSGGMTTMMKIAEGVYQCSLNYARLEFRCTSPADFIIRREFYT